MKRPTLPAPRPAAVAMVAVLLTWYAAWRIERAEGLHLDVVVLATVLALSLGRVVAREGVGDPGRLGARAVALPVVALAASEVGRLLGDHPWLGGAVFVLVLAAAVWVRRFGPAWTSLGTLATLPFITLLVVPVGVGPATARTLWPAAMALLALAVVVLVHLAAGRLGVAGPPAPAPGGIRPTARRLPASTRMAVQLLVALAASYALGRWLLPDHWSWLVLSCYVVCAGNRGRGDVLHKGVLRLLGALVGTASATLLTGAFAAGDRAAIVLLFVVMAAALWLREASYAYWAAGVTAMLALLHGYLGVGGAGELGRRLLGVALGCLVGVVVSWYLLPVRSSDAFRRRWADALAALSDLLTALREDPDRATEARARFRYAVAQLEQLAPAYRFHRRTLHQVLAPGEVAHPADLATGLAEVRDRLEELAELPPQVLAGQRAVLGGWARQVGAIRRRMRGEETEPAAAATTDLGQVGAVAAALEALDRRFTRSAWLRLGGS